MPLKVEVDGGRMGDAVDHITVNDATNNVNSSNNVTDNVIDNVTENVTEVSEADQRREDMLEMMRKNPKITTENLANYFSVSRMTISRDINLLRKNNRLEREDGDFGGRWIVK